MGYHEMGTKEKLDKYAFNKKDEDNPYMRDGELRNGAVGGYKQSQSVLRKQNRRKFIFGIFKYPIFYIDLIIKLKLIFLH